MVTAYKSVVGITESSQKGLALSIKCHDAGLIAAELVDRPDFVRFGG